VGDGIHDEVHVGAAAFRAGDERLQRGAVLVPGDEPAEAAAPLGRAGERQPRQGGAQHARGVLGRVRERDPRAERHAEEQKPVEAQRGDELVQKVGAALEGGLAAPGPVVAARQVERDDAKVLGQRVAVEAPGLLLVDHAVHEHERRARAGFAVGVIERRARAPVGDDGLRGEPVGTPVDGAGQGNLVSQAHSRRLSVVLLWFPAWGPRRP
jgi:hypothetical protein